CGVSRPTPGIEYSGWRGAPTARPWPAAPRTGRCGSGTRPVARSCPPWLTPRASSTPWRSAPTAGRRSRRASTRPAGAVAAQGGGRTGRVWDVSSGKELFVYRGHEVAVTALAFPDGKHVVSADAHGIVNAWEAATGKTLWSVRGPEGPVFAVAVASGVRFLATT